LDIELRCGHGVVAVGCAFVETRGFGDGGIYQGDFGVESDGGADEVQSIEFDDRRDERYRYDDRGCLGSLIKYSFLSSNESSSKHVMVFPS
jgi:hypothetical protein